MDSGPRVHHGFLQPTPDGNAGIWRLLKVGGPRNLLRDPPTTPNNILPNFNSRIQVHACCVFWAPNSYILESIYSVRNPYLKSWFVIQLSTDRLIK